MARAGNSLKHINEERESGDKPHYDGISLQHLVGSLMSMGKCYFMLFRCLLSAPCHVIRIWALLPHFYVFILYLKHIERAELGYYEI